MKTWRLRVGWVPAFWGILGQFLAPRLAWIHAERDHLG